MAVYAENTSVPVEKSRAEIERVLERYGASHFGYLREPDKAAIEFVAAGRRVRFVLPLPDRSERKFTHTPGRDKPRSEAQAYEAKAKLEAVTSGISQFEDEFLAYIVDPNTGRTVSEVIRPMLAKSYAGRGDVQLALTDQRKDA